MDREQEVVNEDVPMIIGPDSLSAYGAQVDVQKIYFIASNGAWGLPLTLQNGHLQQKWEVKAFIFKLPALVKIHKQFFSSSHLPKICTI